MERLTKRDSIGNYLQGDCIYSDWGVPEKFRGNAVDLFAAYEDTGLEPEEIREAYSKGWHSVLDIIAYAEQAGDVLVETPLLQEYINLGTLDHLRELIQAEQEGRLVVLPCKIGTEVYAVYTSVRGTNPTVFKVGFGYGFIPHWGKAVFATREEAKAALEARTEDKG